MAALYFILCFSFASRVAAYYTSIIRESRGDIGDDEDVELPSHPERLVECVDIGDGLKVPSSILQRMFPYQRRGVSWMWDLHRQGTGGILADEMGAL